MLGIIGGSGVYNIEGLENTRWVKAESSFGEPSDEVLIGELNGQSIAFLPRHGRGHKLSPTDINFRANIAALKRVGVTDIVSVSAVGSLREHLHPGDVVLPAQLVDFTKKRVDTFVGPGLVGHAGCAADYWIHPNVLGQMQEMNAQGIRILRMPYTVAGKTYKAIRFQTEDATSYNARVYDLETGLLIYHGSRVQGAPVYTPPIGGSGTAGVGQGSTQLVTGWIAEIKDFDLPWKDAPPPRTGGAACGRP